MAKKHIHSSGESLNGFIVLGPAPAVSGHVCWSVKCATCGSDRCARGTALRRGDVVCGCQVHVVDNRPGKAAAKVPDDGLINTLTEDLSGALARIDEQDSRITALESMFKHLGEARSEQLAAPAAPVAPVPIKRPCLTWDELEQQVRQLIADGADKGTARPLIRQLQDKFDLDPFDKAHRATITEFSRFLTATPKSGKASIVD